MNKYVALDIWVNEDVEDKYEVLKELEDHLQMNKYDYFLFATPGDEQFPVLLIHEDQIEWIYTVLEDRNINYEYY